MKNKWLLISFAFVAFFFTSCSNVIGYSVLLWNINEKELSDGTVVPVYLKSNISKVYVIGLPDSKEKIEVPLWKLSIPESKRKALKRSALYEEYKGKYATCVLDGLPIRAEKVNTSKQVYRLRKNEVVRTLYKGNGVAPTNGGKPLDGEWLYVLTNDGTFGWCFSYNLRIFEMSNEGFSKVGTEVADVQQEDEVLKNILSTRWYPDYYTTMISKKQFDLNYISTNYGFDTGYASETTRIDLPSISVSFPYSEFVKTESGDYKATEAPIEIVPRNSKYIVVKYTDESGKPKTYNFVSLPEDVKIDSLIVAERERRQKLYKAVQSFGPDFKSGNYGTLSFYDNNVFRWNGFSKLVPSVIPSGAKNSGLIEIKYFLEGTLQNSWDGVWTFHFENCSKEVNFLYKKEANGLRLANANVTVKKDDVVGRTSATVSLPTNSVILFFQK